MIRAVEGPLANIHENAPEEPHYGGPAERLRDVWVAVRAAPARGARERHPGRGRRGDLPWRIEAVLNDPEAWLKR